MVSVKLSGLTTCLGGTIAASLLDLTPQPFSHESSPTNCLLPTGEDLTLTDAT